MISVIVPARNEGPRIGRCLAALAAQTPEAGAFEVLVIDNASIDDTAAIAAGAGAQVISAPQGTVGALRNLGVLHARGDLLAFLDADCVASPSWLAGARAAMTDTDVAVGNVYDLPADAGWIERVWLGDVAPQRWRTTELWSGNMVVRRDAFERCGGFDGSLVSSEDVVLSHALGRYGALHCDPRVRVTHIGGPRTLGAFARQQLWHGFEAWTLFRAGIPRATFGPSIVTLVAYLALLTAALWPGPSRWSLSAAGAGLLLGAAVWFARGKLKRASDRSPAALLRITLLHLVGLSAHAAAILLRALGLRWSGRPKRDDASALVRPRQ